ncbi:MAG TPA: cbb3-type cytochrome c oxidase subunit II [Nitrospirota bacterium]|nr:cbb3-type cytochrome c oxidase subunit II [Nitrospirota bacterium]
MAGDLYNKPILFAIVAAAVVLIGTAVTMFIPMLTAEMHPKLSSLKPYTALQLAGKDIYQREGCNNCHTQTVRPLKTEVMRYGEYSKAGEFAYDRPFLWGSKRTGPDLARIGGKYPDKWHEIHFDNPQSMFAESNMPAYGWLKNSTLDPASIERHMKANGFPYTSDDMAQLKNKTELDALIAYVQVIGTAVKKAPSTAAQPAIKETHMPNPLAGDPVAIKQGAAMYKQHCAACHGDNGQGGIGPSLVDKMFLYVAGDMPDDDYLEVINNGTQPGMIEDGRTAKGGMPSYSNTLDKNKIWALVAYIRSLQGKK